MAYSGTTAASSLSNPPRALLAAGFSAAMTTGFLPQANVGVPNGQGGGLWYYCSTNTTAEVVASNFFTDGKTLGMRPGDLMLGASFATSGTSGVGWMGVVSHVSTSGASLSAVLVV